MLCLFLRTVDKQVLFLALWHNCFITVTVVGVFCSGLVLQDLTFVHIGNADRLADGSINFTKCWQMFMILDHMRRFGKWYVPASLHSIISLSLLRAAPEWKNRPLHFLAGCRKRRLNQALLA